MKKVIKNNYKIIIGFILGLIFSITSVYAIEAYIESNKVSYNNHNKTNVEEAIDELYERSGIHKEKWVDPTLEESGNYPVLKEPLIPVEIKPNGDVYYANENSEWYNYSEKRWANAVILIDNPSNKNYTVGDHILEKDIESYFVWIPRYQYKVWDMGNYDGLIETSQLTNTQNGDTAVWKLGGSNSTLIDIKFVSKTAPKTTASNIGDYHTHPAFTLGNKELSGIWVGKFETGGTSANDIIIKPNVVSWRNQVIKVFFDAGYNYERNLDSHMMKNTEWGAVAYLSHSEYGIGNNVNINNASDMKTGYSATANADQRTFTGITAPSSDKTKTQPWNTPVGYLASITGNISGVYDMGGGAWEYMAAYKKNNTDGDKSTFSAKEIAEKIAAGYIDEYSENSTAVAWNKRILGDATGELGPFYNYLEGSGNASYHSSWYADYAQFVDSSVPWFGRGGSSGDGSYAGQFDFLGRTGDVSGIDGFRIVLAVN